jgi:hypothetical protein
MKYLAVYLDCTGSSFSAPLTKHEGRWMLVTTAGPREITFYMMGNDLVGGFATFEDFRLDEVPEGLRGCDFIELRKRMYETLPWPQKPATSPTPIPEPEDFRLHIEQGNSFRVLQEAGAKGEADYRISRQQARQQALVDLNMLDPRKNAVTAHVRDRNNSRAAVLKPRGGGQFIVKKDGE